jgi:DNA repair exonuclease SbcCD ATPase subunit
MIKTIAHLSDIHIRKLHRFVEYRKVFKRLYKQLKQLKPDIIYVGGDIVHGKLDTSPEEVRLVSNFFLSLSKIAQTVVIPGNHDCNLNNRSREDTLSPIVDLVQRITPNLHYWKKSGKYTIDNVDFGVLSVFDINKEGKQTTDKLPNSKDLDNEYKVALFHGGVGSYTYDNGFQVTEGDVTLQTFDDYDLTLLGDIHKKQFLNSKETIAYCGSLIQQSFQEEPAHGFMLWDLETKTFEFHKVENDYGFKLLEVIDGEIQNKMNYIPPKGNIKIKYWDTSLEQIRDIQIALRKEYPKLKEVKAERQDSLSINGDNRVNKIDIGDVRDTDYQNELIKDFLERNVEGIDEKTVERVFDINELTNSSPEIYDGDVTRNVDWKIKSFEFDNMFSYGENNKVNFEKLNGVVGVVAPNHSGKSAMLDSVAYTIYDTCSRTNKAMEVLNKKKLRFKSKLNVEINGIDYWIEREGILKSRKNRKTLEVTNTCPVNVRFYMIDDSDTEVDLSGAARFNSQYGSGTNEEIRKVLGTFDDFILTSLSLQTNGMNFIDKKQAERKKILSSFMDIDIFEQLETIAKSDSNEERIMLRRFQRKDSYALLSTIQQKIVNFEVKETELSDEDKTLSDKLTELENKKIELVRKLYKIDESYDIEILDMELSTKVGEKDVVEKQLKEDKEYKETLRPLYLEYHEKLAQIDEEKIQSDYEEYKQCIRQVLDLESKLTVVDSKIKTNKLTLKELEKYKYDEECEYCLSNGDEHINHKQLIEGILTKLIDDESDINGVLTMANHALWKVEDAEEKKDEFDRFHDELTQVSHDAVKIGGKISTQESKIEHLIDEIENIKEKIQKYYDLEEKIKQNNINNTEIVKITTEISSKQSESFKVDKEYKQVISKLSVAKSEKTHIEEDIQKLIDIEQKILDYDLYLMALSKDGIPYELISKTIPSIEREINEVLDNMMVGFTLELEMKDKNIDAYICYGDDKWNLELSSGMERFVSSLAIRIGLINVSTLPRPNFLVIDEGFGALDSDNIANMEGAFNYLKTQFNFVMIITHLDTIKDYMDTLIPINVNNGLSKVTFT